ncbi:MAG: hypothetical protein ABIJ56_00055 [Pseudomonadota bacterium]
MIGLTQAEACGCRLIRDYLARVHGFEIRGTHVVKRVQKLVVPPHVMGAYGI